jgi:hypothetical protein
MKIRVERHDHPVLFTGQHDDLRVASAAVPDVGDVAGVEAEVAQMTNGAAR